MARTKQTARKAKGGAKDRQQIATKRQLAMKSKRSQANSNPLRPSKIVFIPNSPSKLPEDMIIFVSGPCLHPEAMDPMSSQREELYTSVWYKKVAKIQDDRPS
ncbi:hypothetical protein Ddc_15794 [Ditylenchus destructor]|nr:hypothetical protein Ddc_15794 [Ditylenchus destructor]